MVGVGLVMSLFSSVYLFTQVSRGAKLIMVDLKKFGDLHVRLRGRATLWPELARPE